MYFSEFARSLSSIYAQCSSWGARQDFNGENALSEGRMWSTAIEIGRVVQWLFQAFRENFIVCYDSSDISEVKKPAEETIRNIIEKWFKAEKIPFSSRMNPSALIQGLENLEKEKGGTLAALIIAFEDQLSADMEAETFVRNHVMTLPSDDTVNINNPVEGFAFWLNTDQLKQDFLTLEGDTLKELKVAMGADENLDLNAFAEHCRQKMGLLKGHLERLSSPEEV